MRTSRSAPSRVRMMQAATDLFATQGYERTSTASIARRAGTSESQLVKHFASKEGVLAAVFEQAWETLNAAARQTIRNLPSPSARLEAIIDLITAALERNQELRLLMLLEGRRIRKRGARVSLTRGFLDFVALLDEVLEAMRDAGELRDDVAVEAVRSALMGAWEGLMRDHLLAQSGYPAGFSLRDIRSTFAMVIGAFRT
jgi:AcrR family transcriptional regulator